MFKSSKIIKSANFKKDYIAFFALFLFGFIVFSEFAVIIGIPIIVNKTRLYADVEMRHELIKTFDSARSLASSISNQNSPFANAAQLILWDMDQTARWMRENYQELDIDFVTEMLSVVKTYSSNLEKMKSAETNFYLQFEDVDFELLKKNISKKMEQ
ncbi:MAG: hypothetical protein IKD09_03350 [Lentisphaeria bacterium]|nr:hypothetical protein [Lentisphaeria bacterium]